MPAPVPESEPGSVGDLCTKDRVPKKVHLSPPLPSFPPMSVLGMGLLSSGVVRKGVELSCNQLLYSPKANQQVNSGHLPFERLLKMRPRVVSPFRKDKTETDLRLRAGDEWGLTQGVTLGVTEGVTEGVPLGVDCADVVSLSSLKSPVGILNFCRGKTQEM